MVGAPVGKPQGRKLPDGAPAAGEAAALRDARVSRHLFVRHHLPTDKDSHRAGVRRLRARHEVSQSVDADGDGDGEPSPAMRRDLFQFLF